tara:strand:+ start:478 stop:1302 length:825 start_codon:yes stop_codon:yes gene_type:complete
LPKASAIITLIVSIVLSIGTIWIGNNINFLPAGASTNAPIYDELSMVLFAIGTILFIGMVAFIIYSLVKFRSRPGQEGDGLAIEGNITLEIFWTAVPAIIILFIGLYSYDIYDRMGGMQPLGHNAHDHKGMNANERIWGGIGSGTIDSTNNSIVASLPVEVTAQQFAFLFHYPKGDIISGELHVPINQQVSMRMDSKDVIHAFWVPQFRIKQDIIPGQPTILNFTATKTGRFPIVCAELCGPYHGGMRSTVVVEDQSDYQEWFEKNAKPAISNT